MPSSARVRFAAALVLFLAWVGALAALACTSSTRPSTQAVDDGPARETAPTEPVEPR